MSTVSMRPPLREKIDPKKLEQVFSSMDNDQDDKIKIQDLADFVIHRQNLAAITQQDISEVIDDSLWKKIKHPLKMSPRHFASLDVSGSRCSQKGIHHKRRH
eukprot:Sdes_comp15598_c0_seq1m4587